MNPIPRAPGPAALRPCPRRRVPESSGSPLRPAWPGAVPDLDLQTPSRGRPTSPPCAPARGPARPRPRRLRVPLRPPRPGTPSRGRIPKGARPSNPAPLPSAPAQVGAGWRRGAPEAPQGRGRQLHPGFVRAPRPPAARASLHRAQPAPAGPRPPSGWFAA